MSNSISEQTREVINDVNFQTLEQNKSSRYQQTQTAQAQKSTSAQKTGKDVVLPASPKGSQKSDAKSVEENNAPQLPYPGAQFGGFQKQKEVSMIALMGKVLSLQAKTNSNFWSTMYQETGKMMQMEVNFAPVIGSAIQNAYQQQSEATKAQANQALWTGVVSLAAFGIGVAIGSVMEVNDEASGIKQDSAEYANRVKPSAPEDEEGENGGLENADPAKGDGVEQDVDEASQQINNDDKDDVPKRTGKRVSEKFSQFSKKLSSWWGKTFQVMMGMDMLNKGINGVSFEKYYQDQVSDHQGQEGVYQALSKEAEQYAQFYGQAFSRGEDLRQGGQQNIDYAMNILKSASDTIAQTVASMFRG